MKLKKKKFEKEVYDDYGKACVWILWFRKFGTIEMEKTVTSRPKPNLLLYDW